MSSPAKRRKKNDYEPSAQPVRSLDFFFAKQREKEERSGLKKADNPDLSVWAPSAGTKESRDNDFTDEELARKLQREWDAEAAELNGARRGPDTDDRQRIRLGNLGVVAPSEQEVKIPLMGESSSPRPTEATKSQKQTLTLQSSSTDEDQVCANIPFDESPLTFDPQKYIPDLRRHWASDLGRSTYALLTRCFVLVNSTTSRIKIVDTLVNLLRTIIEGDHDSLLPAVWLATNSISPPYIDLELGLGGSAISKALKKVCGLDNAGLKTLYNKYGDAGDVAFEAKKRQSFTLRKPKPLTIRGVFEALVKIANSKGTGSQEVKQRIVERLLQDTRGAEESRYMVRTLVQHLRIGAVKTTMLIALSRAFMFSRPSNAEFEIRAQDEMRKLSKEELREAYTHNEEIVKACFARHPNYNDLVPALLEIGVCHELLLRCGLSLHIPLRPMLGSITRDLGEMLTKLQGRDFSCEFKYDGQRAQVHCDEKGTVTIFSRHLEVMTEKYPDLVELVPKIRGESVSSFILEGEVVAVDKETGDLKPFQVLTNRAKKDVAISEVTIDVCLFAFDLMYLNGEELLNRPFRERRSLLRSLFTEIGNHFTWVKSIDATSADSDIVLDFFKQATDIKCEGIMVKVLDNVDPTIAEANAIGNDVEEQPAPQTPKKPRKGAKRNKDIGDAEKPATRRKALLATYEPDKRLDSWLKVKKDYHDSADTLDLIPVAGWHGQGRKSKWWSPILLAVRNPETGCLEAVTKCISGFTDKFYQANREKYDPDIGQNVISKPGYVEYAGFPDVWFEPQEVWEMAFADITLSPTYTAAIGLISEERGLSTRFPRFLKVREDKSLDEATTSDELATLYRKQEARAIAEGKPANAAEAELDEERL